MASERTAVTGWPAHAAGLQEYPRVIPLGDTAVSVEFGNAIDPHLHGRVRGMEAALMARNVRGIRELVPSFRSLLVIYEPVEIEWPDLLAAIRAAAAEPRPPAVEPGRVWTLPVAYGASMGQDLVEVAQRCGMDPDEVVAVHSAPEYLIYLVGFGPGIPLLGGLPDRLRLPRRAAPRPKVPARSVIIAGGQASIMSIEAPSGWHILGRTPLWPFRPGRPSPFLFRPGDVVRFRPIGEAEYAELSAAASAGTEIVVPEELPRMPAAPPFPAAGQAVPAAARRVSS